MNTRKFRDIEVSAVGMGCMGFTHAYGQGPEEKEGIELVHYAFDKSCRLFDTAQMYSYFKNEEFVGKALKDLPRDQVVISDKFWPYPLLDEQFPEGKLSEAGIRRDLENSLKRLHTDYIDIYTMHLIVDEEIENVATVMGKLIREGKIRSWGLSSPTADQIRRGNAITPLTSIQSEYSMMERKHEKEIIPLCKELNIGFMAFSPMGNGFLSGKYKPTDTFEGNDLRRVITRFNEENMEKNQPLLDLIKSVAETKNCTSAQIALAWILKVYDSIVPIPGMRKAERIDENLGAADVELSDEEYAALNAELDKLTIYGDRKGEDIAKLGSVPTYIKI